MLSQPHPNYVDRLSAANKQGEKDGQTFVVVAVAAAVVGNLLSANLFCVHKYVFKHKNNPKMWVRQFVYILCLCGLNFYVLTSRRHIFSWKILSFTFFWLEATSLVRN